MHRRSLLLSGVALSASALSAPRVWAQSDRPALRVLVGFPPGGSADIIARLLAERLPAQLGGQSVVVDNKPGAAGRIAIEQLKNAAEDKFFKRPFSFPMAPRTRPLTCVCVGH